MLLHIQIILLGTVLVFLLMRVIPGDPALLILAGDFRRWLLYAGNVC